MPKADIAPNGVMRRMMDAKYRHLRMELMMKYTVKTVLNNVIQNKEGEFTYNQKLVSMKWEEKAKTNAVQSGKGPGEFGPDYSDRKKYHLDYHANWEHPTHDTMGKPLLKRTPYPSHVIEPYNMDPDFGPDQLKDE